MALADAKKGIAMFGQAQLNVPIIGLVENMSYFITPGTDASLENRHYIFGKEGGKRLAEEYDLPFLGQIPLIQQIREGGDRGLPVMVDATPEIRQPFEDFAASVVRNVAVNNAATGTELPA